MRAYTLLPAYALRDHGMYRGRSKAMVLTSFSLAHEDNIKVAHLQTVVR
jgi:hypothetical protein